MPDYKQMSREYLQLLQDTLAQLDLDALSRTMELLVQALEQDRTIYIFGNGGSAATASHFQNDFNKGISEYTDKKFRFSCLNDNVATLMAIANDISYEEVFRFQLRGRIRPGDLVMAISGSGNSPNVLRAGEYAREQGNTVIGLTGMDGGKLKALSDVSLHAPTMSMQVTEDVHMIFDHLMMAVLYKTLAGRDHVRR